MKKQYKKRQLYFFLEEPYPENIWLTKKLVWPKKKLLPNFRRVLRTTIKHLRNIIKEQKIFFKNSSFQKNSLRNPENPPLQKRGEGKAMELRGSWNRKKPSVKIFFFEPIRKEERKKKNFFFFSMGQARSHITTPFTIYKKVSHLYLTLKERKKFRVLYGKTNQKDFKEKGRGGGKFCLSFCELKMNVLFVQTGCFSNISILGNEIKHKRILRNNEQLLSPSVPCNPGDFFQLKKSPSKKNQYIEKFYSYLKKTIPRLRYKLLLKEKLFENKKSIFLIKKILFYKYFRALSLQRRKKKTYRSRSS